MKATLENGTELKLTKYAFPKRGNAPDGYALVVNGTSTTEVRRTGGGKFPIYTYFAIEGASYYTKADIPAGTKVTITK